MGQSYDYTSLYDSEKGYILLGKKIVLGLENISLKVKANSDTLLTLDGNKTVSNYPTTTEWSISASGKFMTLTADTYNFTNSGDTRVTGATNSSLLLTTTLARTIVPVTVKLISGKFLTSTGFISDYSWDIKAGEAQTFSIDITGASGFVESTT
jgi:hypothetical protein